MKLIYNTKTVFIEMKNGKRTEVFMVNDVKDIRKVEEDHVIIVEKKDNSFLVLSMDLLVNMDIVHKYGYRFDDVEDEEKGGIA